MTKSKNMKKLLTIAAIAALPLSAEAFNGSYAGISAGMSKRTTSSKIADTRTNLKIDQQTSFSKTHPAFGIQAGYGKTLANKVYVGAELDFVMATGEGKKSFAAKHNGGAMDFDFKFKNELRYRTALSARVGYNFGPAIVYTGALVGLESYKAVANAQRRTLNPHSFQSKKFSKVSAGVLLGAEYAINEAFTAGLEGRYSSTGKKSFAQASAKSKGWDLMVRMNYGF